MSNSNLAGLQEAFPSSDFTLAAAPGGATTEATSLYYWVNGYSRGGMNLLTSLGQVTVSAGQKLVWTVINKADGDDVFGWILSANSTNDATGAKILCVARARETVNQDATIDPPIAIELTHDAHFLLGETVTNLPTGADLVDGMVRYQDGNYRQYNAETLEWETVNGWSTYLSSTLSVLTPGLFKNGCDLPILSNESIIPLPDYSGGTTPYIRLSLLNGLNEGTGIVLPTGTRLSLFVRLNGSDDLGGQYLSGRIELVPRQKTRRSDGTVTALSNTPVTWVYGTPFYTLTSDLERGYALEFDMRVVGATLPAGVTFTFFIAEYGLLSQPAIANASGDLVYATGGRLRILPALLGAVRLSGSGVVNVDGETTSYPINANATEQYSLGLQSNTANQKATISGIGNGSIEFKTGTLLPTEAVRAIVSTEAITCAPSAWIPVGAIAANQSINVTVNYPCDANGVGTIRADYPDVIAGLSGGEFNPNQLRVFLRRDGVTVTETTAIAVNPNTSQIFTISAVGTDASLPSDPGDAYRLWDYETISGVSSISASDLPAGTYEVAIAYQYLGNRICKISHSVNDGCIPELAVSLSEATELASAYSDVYDSSNVLQAKTTGLQFGIGLTTTKNGDRLIVSTTNKIYADKIIAPTVTDDETEGYVVGDKWLDTVEKKEYTLIDSSAGAAEWRQVGGGADVIELSDDVTWYVASDGGPEADGLTVGTPITLEEAASRVFRVVPTDTNFTITLELADGTYNYINGYTFKHPQTAFDFAIKLHGQDWVGINSYPTANITKELKLVGFNSYSYLENIATFVLILEDTAADIYNISNSLYSAYFNSSYAYVWGKYKLSPTFNSGVPIQCYSNSFLDLDAVDFDITNSYAATTFIKVVGAELGLNIATTVSGTGTISGTKVTFDPKSFVYSYGAGTIVDKIAALPGTATAPYPNYLVEPSNTLATTASLATVATSGSYNDLSDLPSIPTTATGITVDTTNFNNNLSGTDTTVQAALETLDDLIASVGGGGLTTVYTTDVTLTATAGNMYLLDGTTTVNLPAGVNGDRIGFADYLPNFYASPVTINPNGAETIAGLASLTLDNDRDCIELVFQTDRWVITSLESFADSVGSSFISNNAPATTNATGTAGQVAYDNNYFYVCVGTDTWVRSPLTTW